MPVSFGLRTTNGTAQAEGRACGSCGDKGTETMSALLDPIDAIHALQHHTESPVTGGRPDKVTGDRTGR